MELFEHVGLSDPIEELEVSTSENGSRYYVTPSGKKYPSVTTVTGWAKREFFKEWRKKNPKESSRVLSVGNRMHQVVEDFINNKEDCLKGCKPDVVSLFYYLKPLLKNINNVRAQEIALWSDMLRMAGRADCIAEYKGKLSIIDFKSSRREKKVEHIDNYFAQATAYSIMWQEITGESIDQIVILISCEDGSIQEFVDKPVNHVRTLKDMIDLYWDHHGVPLST
jgi:hypothetical protein